MQSAFVTPSPFLQTRPAVLKRSNASSSVPRRRKLQPTMTVQRVRNAREFVAALPLPESNPLVVFSFVTNECTHCKHTSDHFARMASDFGSEARFFEMDVSERENKLLGQRLGVDTVPAFQFYTFKQSPQDSGVGMLDEFVGPKIVDTVRERLAHYVKHGLNLDDYDFEPRSD